MPQIKPQNLNSIARAMMITRITMAMKEATRAGSLFLEVGRAANPGSEGLPELSGNT